MNIWLLHVGEELPVDENPRLFRYGHLAERLAGDGHQVLRWAPTFQHFRKVHRFASDRRVDVSSNYSIRFVHAPGYRRNISFARLWSYRYLASRLREQMASEPPPDIIVSGLPSLEWCEAAVDFGTQVGAEVVLDVRDLWPDVYLQALPKWLRPAARPAITPLVRRTQRMFRRATAVYGVSQSYLDWGLAHAGRQQGERDCVFPLGYLPQEVDRAAMNDRVDMLRKRGVDPTKTICMYAGLIERTYDVETIVAAAKQIEQSCPGRYQFVVCGDGSKASRVRKLAAGTSNVILLGWVDQPTIAAVMLVASVGLASYAAGAPQSLPNKPFEYMAGGLAIATSLTGELQSMLDKHACGVTYEAGDAGSLVAAVRNLTHDPESLAAMGARSWRLLDSQFHVDHVYRQFADSLVALRSREPTSNLLTAAA